MAPEEIAMSEVLISDDAPTNVGVQPPLMAPRRPAAAETVRLYASDWSAFVAWCRADGHQQLPANPHRVALYLEELAATLSYGALARRLAAIVDRHRQRGLASPGAGPLVRAVMRTARRSATPRRPPAPQATQLTRMASRCPGDLAGLRDRALLLLAAAGLGRAALVSLDAEHVRVAAERLELNVRVDDRAAELEASTAGSHRLFIPLAPTPNVCPVRAMSDWLLASDTQFGPVFRKIDRWGNIEYRRLGTDAVRRILARHAPSTPRHRRPKATS